MYFKVNYRFKSSKMARCAFIKPNPRFTVHTSVKNLKPSNVTTVVDAHSFKEIVQGKNYSPLKKITNISSYLVTNINT